VTPPRTAKLFLRDGTFVRELEIPAELNGMPDVIFFGTRAFHSLLAGRGQYTECSCWRAPEESAEVERKVEAAS
jgi:hypothetical protein